MKITVIKNDVAAKDGEGVLFLSTSDYKVYAKRMREILDAETLPEEIKEAQTYILMCESDLGFMGSPTYDAKKKLVDEYFAPIEKAKKEAKERSEYERLKKKFAES